MDDLEERSVFTGVCESIGVQGDGIFKVGSSGFVIMVPNTVLGEEYTVEITRLFERYGFGTVVS